MKKSKLRKRLIISAIFPSIFLLPAGGYASYMVNGLEITPNATVQESYNDNVTYLKNNPISDAITQMMLDLGIKQEGKTGDLSLDTKVEEDIFAQHSSFDSTSEYENVAYNQDFSEYGKLKVTDAFSHSEDPTSFQNAFGSISGRYFTYQNTFDMGYHHDLTEQLGVNFDYSDNSLEISTKGSSDSLLNTVGTGLEYDLSSATIIKTDYTYKLQDFNPGLSSTENELGLGLRRYLTPQLYADLRSGVDFINSFNGQNNIEPLYVASLTKDLDETTQTGISFQKQYATTEYRDDIFNSWQVSANYIKDFTSRISAKFNVFYGDGNYISTDIKEVYTGASISGSYEMTQNSKVTLSYTFTKDDSTLPSDSYTKDLVTLGVNIGF